MEIQKLPIYHQKCLIHNQNDNSRVEGNKKAPDGQIQLPWAVTVYLVTIDYCCISDMNFKLTQFCLKNANFLNNL